MGFTLSTTGKYRGSSLIDNDEFSRVVYCQRINAKLAQDPNFLERVLWTDEAQFTRSGLFNSCNFHMWMEDNPHATWEHSHQYQFSVNMWAGIIDNKLIFGNSTVNVV